MSKAKLILLQTSLITLGIFAATGTLQVICHFTGEPYVVEWYFTGSVILVGVLCSLPTLLLLGENEKHFPLRILLHFCLLFAIVSLSGYLLRWYTVLSGYVVVMLIFVFVYVFVWCMTLWIYKQDDEQINSALQDLRDEE